MRWTVLALLLLTTVAYGRVEVLELSPCEGVVKRTPVRAAERFSAHAETVWAFMRLKNRGEPTEVRVTWFLDGAALGHVSLEVGQSDGWRTWARRRILGRSGRWEVAVTHEGKELARSAFVIETAGAQPEPSPAEPLETEGAKSGPTVPNGLSAPNPEPVPHPEVVDPQDVAPSPSEARRDAVHRQAPTSGRHCRALVSLRLPEGAEGRKAYVVADVRLGARPEATSGPGTLSSDGRHFYALHLVTHDVSEASRYGRVRRSWDILVGARLPGGAPKVWTGFPATLAPPFEPLPDGLSILREDNHLEVVATLGPLVSLRADLGGHAGGEYGFDNSRYMTLQAPGQPFDITQALPRDLRARAAQQVARLRPRTDGAPDLSRHDFRRSALRWKDGRLRLATLLRCCSWEENRGHLAVDFTVPIPKAIEPHLPRAGTNEWVAPDHCGLLRFEHGHLLQSVHAKLERVPLNMPLPEAVLGVYWLSEGVEFDARWLETSRRKIR